MELKNIVNTISLGNGQFFSFRSHHLVNPICLSHSKFHRKLQDEIEKLLGGDGRNDNDSHIVLHSNTDCCLRVFHKHFINVSVFLNRIRKSFQFIWSFFSESDRYALILSSFPAFLLSGRSISSFGF